MGGKPHPFSILTFNLRLLLKMRFLVVQLRELLEGGGGLIRIILCSPIIIHKRKLHLKSGLLAELNAYYLHKLLVLLLYIATFIFDYVCKKMNYGWFSMYT